MSRFTRFSRGKIQFDDFGVKDLTFCNSEFVVVKKINTAVIFAWDFPRYKTLSRSGNKPKVKPAKSSIYRTALLHCEPAQLSFDGQHQAKAGLRKDLKRKENFCLIYFENKYNQAKADLKRIKREKIILEFIFKQ